MGMRFRKSIKIAPGVKVNVGKKSVGVSVGGKHGGVSMNSKNGARVRASAPGTGFSYSEKIGKSSKKSGQAYNAPDEDDPREEMTPLEQQEAIIEELEPAIGRMKIAIPIFGAMLLFIAVFAGPLVFLAVIGLCVWWDKWRKKSAHDLAIAKYRANCLKYGLQAHDPPSYEDISPYRDLETYTDRKGRQKKKKPFYRRWWFIAWALFCVWGWAVTGGSGETTTDQAQDPQQEQAEAAQSSKTPEIEVPELETTPEPETIAEPVAPETAAAPSEEDTPQKTAPQEVTPQSRTVYVTSTGKRYHYSSNCGNGKYYESTLDAAKKSGLTPCKKCVG